MATWLPPYGFTCTVHHMKAEKGGTFKMSFTTGTQGGQVNPSIAFDNVPLTTAQGDVSTSVQVGASGVKRNATT